MSSSNCCFLTCIQVSQEAGQVVWYSHLFQNFPQMANKHMKRCSTLRLLEKCKPKLQWDVTSHWSESVQLLSHVRLFEIPWTAARQASLSITNSWIPPKPMSIEAVVPSKHLILCRPLLLLPPIPPSLRVFSNESTLCIRWPKYWCFSFNISPSNEHPGLISLRMDWLDLLAV